MNDKYTLTVDIATVDSLGRNLYSNAAAVLSEFVANALQTPPALRSSSIRIIPSRSWTTGAA